MTYPNPPIILKIEFCKQNYFMFRLIKRSVFERSIIFKLRAINLVTNYFKIVRIAKQ